MRALGYWAAHWLDVAKAAANPGQRARAATLAALLTPIVKAAFTEQGFSLASKALQVFGGYGYSLESAIEQTLRDSRVAMIYEGTNEIQANDLLLRKVLGDGGEGIALLLAELRATGVGASVAIGRWGSMAGPLAAGQILAAGAGASGLLVAVSPGLVIAALAARAVLRHRSCPQRSQSVPGSTA